MWKWILLLRGSSDTAVSNGTQNCTVILTTNSKHQILEKRDKKDKVKFKDHIASGSHLNTQEAVWNCKIDGITNIFVSIFKNCLYLSLTNSQKLEFQQYTIKSKYNAGFV